MGSRWKSGILIWDISTFWDRVDKDKSVCLHPTRRRSAYLHDGHGCLCKLQRDGTGMLQLYGDGSRTWVFPAYRLDTGSGGLCLCRSIRSARSVLIRRVFRFPETLWGCWKRCRMQVGFGREEITLSDLGLIRRSPGESELSKLVTRRPCIRLPLLRFTYSSSSTDPVSQLSSFFDREAF